MSALYVYALLRGAPHAPLGVGLGGEPLRLVECGEVLAVAEEVGAPPGVAAGLLRQHDAIVRRLGEMVPALLPVRFGSVIDNAAALAERLAPASPLLSDALDLVDGKEQMTLRVYRSHPDAMETAPPSDAQEGPGTRYLTGRLDAWRRQHQLPELAPLRRALDPLVVAERVERHTTPPLVASVYHLVPRGAGGEYRSTVETAGAAAAGVSFTVSGPWPAYAFAPEALS